MPTLNTKGNANDRFSKRFNPLMIRKMLLYSIARGLKCPPRISAVNIHNKSEDMKIACDIIGKYN